MAEAGAESELGQRAVAQAILDGTLRSGKDVISSINSYKIVRRYNKRATKSVQDAVAAVFDKGERVTEEKIDLWYAPIALKSHPLALFWADVRGIIYLFTDIRRVVK